MFSKKELAIISNLVNILRYQKLKCKEHNAKLIQHFFMLNSAEHKIFSANKYENANNSWHFHIY